MKVSDKIKFLLSFIALFNLTYAGPNLDQSKVMGPESCGECHTNEVEVWKKTHHATTIDRMHRTDAAKEIAEKMGIRRIKSESLCVECHYTNKQTTDLKSELIAGISCESCHGEARDWIDIHNDYGDGAKKETESAEHKAARIEKAILGGMKNPRDLHEVASNCFQCHLVPNEKLVNVGGHTAGSAGFDLVAWLHGEVRHNFLRTGDKANADNSIESKRELFVLGIILDLENSLRGTAIATQKATYGITMAKRSAKVLAKLGQIQQIAPTKEVEAILGIVDKSMLKLNNKEQLTSVAEKVAVQGKLFAKNGSGKSLAALDKYVPKAEKYKGEVFGAE